MTPTKQIDTMVLDYLSNAPAGVSVSLTDMARNRRFLGVHFGRIQVSVERLERRAQLRTELTDRGDCMILVAA